METGDTDLFTEEELDKLRIFLQADQSGAEALIVAFDSEAGDYRQLFINNVKVHVYVAMKLFKDVWPLKMREKSGLNLDIETLDNTPIPKLKLNPQWRELDLLIKDSDNWPLTERFYYFAKQTVHSGNYDIQWAKFILNVLEKSGGKINIPEHEGKRFLETYRGLFPEIPERNRRVRRQVDETKLIYNLFGFPYQITNYNITEHGYKEYYAWGPQSTVGEITRIAFTRLQEIIEENRYKWDILADTHDSYLVQCPLRDTSTCKKAMQECMNQELTSLVDGTVFRMKSECQCGFNWSKKKSNNLLGLRELKWL